MKKYLTITNVFYLLAIIALSFFFAQKFHPISDLIHKGKDYEDTLPEEEKKKWEKTVNWVGMIGLVFFIVYLLLPEKKQS